MDWLSNSVPIGYLRSNSESDWLSSPAVIDYGCQLQFNWRTISGFVLYNFILFSISRRTYVCTSNWTFWTANSKLSSFLLQICSKQRWDLEFSVLSSLISGVHFNFWFCRSITFRIQIQLIVSLLVDTKNINAYSIIHKTWIHFKWIWNGLMDFKWIHDMDWWSNSVPIGCFHLWNLLYVPSYIQLTHGTSQVQFGVWLIIFSCSYWLRMPASLQLAHYLDSFFPILFCF